MYATGSMESEQLRSFIEFFASPNINLMIIILKIPQKKHKKMIQLMLSLLLLSGIAESQTQIPCQAKTQLPGLFQDAITLKFDTAHLRFDFSYPSSLFMQEQPQLALTLNQLDIYDATVMDYEIVGLVGKGGDVSIRVNGGGGRDRWRSVGLVVWLVGKDMLDLAVGHVFFGFFSIILDSLKYGQNTTIKISQKQQPALKLLNNGSRSNPKLFISSFLGLSLSCTNKSLSYAMNGTVNRTNYQSNTYTQHIIEISLKMGATTNLRYGRINYLLYTPSKSSDYKSQTFTLSQTFTTPSGVSPTKWSYITPPLEIFPQKYLLIGITQLSTPSSSSSPSVPISLWTGYKPGLTDSLQYSTRSTLQKVSINLLVIGSDIMMACIECPDSYVKEDLDGSVMCVAEGECGADKVAWTDADGVGYACRECGVGGVLIGGKCVCGDGFVEVKGSCRKSNQSTRECPDSNFQISERTKTCQCKPTLQLDNHGYCNQCNSLTQTWNPTLKKCECLPTYYYNSLNNKCIKKDKQCPQHQNYGTKGCVCLHYAVPKYLNTNLSGNQALVCQECKIGMYHDVQGAVCRTCGVECQDCLDKGVCLVCRKGYVFKDFKCLLACGEGSQNRSQCQKNSSALNPSQPKEGTVEPKPEQYKLTISRNSPIYLPTILLLDLTIKPPRLYSQQQLKQLLKMETSSPQSTPQKISFVQDKTNQEYVRCYLFYKLGLPNLDFIVKVLARFSNKIVRTVSLHVKGRKPKGIGGRL